MIDIVVIEIPMQDILQGLEETIEEHNKLYEGWYCISLKPKKCNECGELMCYVEPDYLHVIIVWEEKDNPHMLELAQYAKELGAEPRIETYHPMIGPCISWEDCVTYDL